MLQESKKLGDGSHLLKKVYISSHNKKRMGNKTLQAKQTVQEKKKYGIIRNNKRNKQMTQLCNKMWHDTVCLVEYEQIIYSNIFFEWH